MSDDAGLLGFAALGVLVFFVVLCVPMFVLSLDLTVKLFSGCLGFMSLGALVGLAIEVRRERYIYG